MRKRPEFESARAYMNRKTRIGVPRQALRGALVFGLGCSLKHLRFCNAYMILQRLRCGFEQSEVRFDIVAPLPGMRAQLQAPRRERSESVERR